jgi:hypothetical protein
MIYEVEHMGLKTGVLTLIAVSLLLPTSANAAAAAPSQTAIQDATSPNIVQQRQMRMRCPDVRVENIRMSSNLRTFPLRNIIQQGSGNIGGAAIGPMGIPLVVSFNPTCPSDYPYLVGMDETWGGGGVMFFFGAGGSLAITCATTPRPYMSMKYDTSTWQNNPYCQ